MALVSPGTVQSHARDWCCIERKPQWVSEVLAYLKTVMLRPSPKACASKAAITCFKAGVTPLSAAPRPYTIPQALTTAR